MRAQTYGHAHYRTEYVYKCIDRIIMGNFENLSELLAVAVS